MGKWCGLGLALGLGASSLVACSASSTRDESTRSAHSRLEEGYFYLAAPPSGAVGSPFHMSGTMAYSPVDPSKTLTDVTLLTTITGSFTLDALDSVPGVFACSQAPAPGGVTVTCHAAQITAGQKGGFVLRLRPTAEGDIDATSTLSVGGVVVDGASATIPIHANTGADLGVLSWSGGGLAYLNRETRTNFFSFNNGPAEATGVRLSFALNGPGKLTWVAPPMWGVPPPPPPPGPSAPASPPTYPPNPCSWTDTTAVCDLGTVPVFNGMPIEVGFEGTAEGLVTVQASVQGNEPDPAPFNDTAQATFQVIVPVVADLGLTLSDAPDPTVFKKPLTYTLTVKNHGPDASSDAHLEDFLPYDLPLVSLTTSQGGCFSGPWGNVACDLGPLAPSATATVTIVVKPDEGGTLSNSAYLFPSAVHEIDPDFMNNLATAETTVKGPNPPVETQSSVEKLPIAGWVSADCAHDFVALEGTIHVGSHTFMNDKAGRYQYEQHSNLSGVTGHGLLTGDTYRLAETTRSFHKFSGGFPQAYEFIDTATLVGKAMVANMRLRVHYRVSFAPDGSIKHEIQKYSVECK